MAKYKSFIHVERLGRDETDGILNGTCYVTPKIDGTNAVVYFDEDKDSVCGGSRTRELNTWSDNAGFYNWLISDNTEAINLRSLVKNNPNLIIYGEWGCGKVAHIKDYNDDAKTHMYVFDIYDTDKEHYLHYDLIENIIAEYGLDNYLVPLFAVIDNPTEEQLINIAKNNKFLLDNANHPGEGIVIRNYDFRDKWGHYQVAKVVLDEFKQKQGKQKIKADSKRIGIEQDIVDRYVTDAEISKAMAKVVNICGEDSFDKKNGKMIGMTLNLVFNDFISENITDICKRWKRPVINFQTLNNLCNIAVRNYIGL